jgi:hypothetical protein
MRTVSGRGVGDKKSLDKWSELEARPTQIPGARNSGNDYALRKTRKPLGMRK